MMGHLLHVLGGKKKIHTAFRGVVGAWDALGLVHASTAFFFFFWWRIYVTLCGDSSSGVQCMEVRVIQPLPHRNQTTLQHELIGKCMYSVVVIYGLY